MRTKEKPAPCREGTGRKAKQRYFFKPHYITKQPQLPSTLPKIKNWCVDLLAERFFQGADSLKHRIAERFWSKSGRRLRDL